MGQLVQRGKLVVYKIALPTAWHCCAAAIAAGLAALSVPTLTRSSLAEMGDWIDWLNLLMIAGAIGLLFGLLIWPFAAMPQAGACPLQGCCTTRN